MKKIIPLALVFFLLVPINVLGAGITGGSYNASDDIYYVYMDFSGADRFVIRQDSSGLTWNFTIDSSVNYTTLTCNGSYTYTFYSNGSVVATDSITASGIQNENSACQNSDDGGDGGNNGGGGSGSECGCIFNTPGWGDYMDKIDDIIGAIPPPPNWGSVADTFRDSIVPSLIGGVGNMLGSPPAQPSAPGYPPALNDGGLRAPTGRDSGLDGFNAGDIKDNADGIKFEEDDSGGFKIDNPLEVMPEQETFLPEEPENPRPEDPEEPEVTAPKPEEKENKAPTPEEPENITPVPEEPENITPIPEVPEVTTPTPEDPENITPVPEERENKAPTPEEKENEVPLPGGGDNTPPLPGGGSPGYPMPGGNNGGYPLPGNPGGGYPMPNF